MLPNVEHIPPNTSQDITSWYVPLIDLRSPSHWHPPRTLSALTHSELPDQPQRYSMTYLCCAAGAGDALDDFHKAHPGTRGGASTLPLALLPQLSPLGARCITPTQPRSSWKRKENCQCIFESIHPLKSRHDETHKLRSEIRSAT